MTELKPAGGPTGRQRRGPGERARGLQPGSAGCQSGGQSTRPSSSPAPGKAPGVCSGRGDPGALERVNPLLPGNSKSLQ